MVLKVASSGYWTAEAAILRVTRMPSPLATHSMPRVEHRSPTSGPLLDIGAITAFLASAVQPSGVEGPTVLIINLEGRFPGAAALYELMVPFGRAISSGAYGQLALVFATPDPTLASVIRAIAQSVGIGMFLAPSADALDEAEPIGPLTPTDIETLEVLRRLGGRASVSMLAQAADIDHKAAGNRLTLLDQKQLVLRVDRSRREGHLYLDPRAGVEKDEPIGPSSPEFGVPADVRADVKALAEMQGREPDEVLAEAWTEFLRKHAAELAREHKEVAEMMRKGDKASVARYTARHSEARARSRTRGRRP
ncbi:MAG TPA: hypothetical protein VNG12_26180 [Acidimicrobiales bacterium]|nr:hypothetical protein [Acidimicrobiales bacterium]